jgi:hypothetical protein
VGYGGGQNSVVGVGDANRTSVRDEACVFLGDEEKETMVMPRGGSSSLTNGFENSEKDRPSELRGSPPCSVRNAIRARGRVVGVFNRKDDIIEERGREESGINLGGVGVEKGFAFKVGGGSRARGPDSGPETTSNLGFPSVVTNRGVRGVRTQSRDASSAAGEFVLDSRDRVRFWRGGR